MSYQCKKLNTTDTTVAFIAAVLAVPNIEAELAVTVVPRARACHAHARYACDMPSLALRAARFRSSSQPAECRPGMTTPLSCCSMNYTGLVFVSRYMYVY